MSYMSYYIIPVKSCHSCLIIHVMSFMSCVVLGLYRRKFSKVGREGGGGKFVFLRCQAEGKNT
jgi:hypothetical protein